MYCIDQNYATVDCATPGASVVLSAAEWASLQHSFSALFQITPEQGAQLAWSIVFVWAVAFGFRAAIQTLKEAGSQTTDKE